MARLWRMVLAVCLGIALVSFLYGCSDEEAGCVDVSCDDAQGTASDQSDIDSDPTDESNVDPVEPGSDDSDGSDDTLPSDDCALPEWDALYGTSTEREPDVQEHTEDALITRLADRARDRHARAEGRGGHVGGEDAALRGHPPVD